MVAVGRQFWCSVVLRALPLHAAAHEAHVKTDLGTVVGEETQMKDGGKVRIFRGLPFALPPVGNRRWAAPDTRLPRFHEPYPAKEFKASCPNIVQKDLPLCHTCSTRGVKVEPTWPNSEDCLYLNIMTPTDANEQSQLPVAVFVHGGGSVVGWAGVYTNTSALVQQGLVYVTVQYRLASLGFLSLREADLHGNYAVLDLVAALQWIASRISAFGGDPNKVMVFGQSAGAMMVESLLLTPYAKGLFHSAILESSAFLEDLPSGGVPAAAFFASIGCGTAAGIHEQLACARSKPWQAIIDSSPFGSYSSLELDGNVLPLQPRHAFREGTYNRVAVVTGYNHQENRIDDYFTGQSCGKFVEHFADLAVARQRISSCALSRACCGQNRSAGFEQVMRLYSQIGASNGYDLVSAACTDSSSGVPNQEIARYLRAHTPVYTYSFGVVSTSPTMAPFGSMHLLELMFILNDTYIFDGHVMSAPELSLARAMAFSWGTMAKTGRPGAIGKFDWSPFGQVGGSVDEETWYVIGLLGGISTPGFRKEQLSFFEDWQRRDESITTIRLMV